MQPTGIDFSPLDTPVTFRDAVKRGWHDSVSSGQAKVLQYIVWPILIVLLLAFTAFVNTSAESIVPVLWVTSASVMFGAFMLYLYSIKGRDALHIELFAGRNGFVVERDIDNPSQFSGLIFSAGHSRQLRYLLSRGGVQIGDYQFVTGSGKSQQTHNYNFISVKLTRKLPHIVLDARSNNLWGLTNLPESFNRGQRLKLEGDFDSHFDVYCPEGYEQDALYVLSPELMAVLVDKGARYDAEIIDDRIYFYQLGPMRWSSTYLGSLVAPTTAIAAEVLDNSERYADARVGNAQANLVAPEGQRLKRSIPPVTYILVAIFILMFIWNIMSVVVQITPLVQP